MTDGSVDLSGIESDIVDLNNLINDLGDEIKSVDSRRNRGDIDLGNRIDTLNGTVEMLQDHLERLSKQVAESFRILVEETRTSREQIVQSIDEVRETSREGLYDVKETSRIGLRKVSAGAAIIDILKALSDSQSTATTIERALIEVGTRRSQAEATVEEKRSEYDQHFEQISEGFIKQVRTIGAHVYGVTQEVLPLLQELRIDEDLAAQSVAIVGDVHAHITEHRSRVLKAERDKIDFNRIARFQELRRALNDFLVDESLMRIEQDNIEGEVGELQPFGLPIVAVHLTDDFLAPNARTCQTFCLNSQGSDCYSKPDPAIEYAPLTKTIQIASEALNAKDAGVPLDSNSIDGIRAGLSRLTTKGLLKPEHQKLIEQHFELHDLYWME